MSFASIPQVAHPERVMPWLTASVAIAAMTLWIGPLMLPAAAAGLAAIALLPRYKTAFLLMLAFLPALFEAEESAILHNLWLLPYGLLVCSWAYVAITAPRRIYVQLPLTALYILLVLVCLLSLVGSPDLSVLANDPNETDPYRPTIENLVIISLMVLAMSCGRTARDLRKVYWVIVGSGLVYGATIAFLGPEMETATEVGRWGGVFQGPHPAAIFMLLCAALAVELVRIERGRARLLAAGSAAFFLATQLLTNVRTVLLVLPFLVLLWILLEWGPREMLAACLVLALILVAAFPVLPSVLQASLTTVAMAILSPIVPVDGQGQLSAQWHNFQSRLLHVRLAVDVARQHPWLGVGLGRQALLVPVPRGTLIHNYYMTMLVETGLLGLALLMSIIGYSLVRGFQMVRRYRAAENWRMFYLGRGLWLGFIGILLSLMANPGLYHGLRPLWILVGLLASMSDDQARGRVGMSPPLQRA